jgi:PAS domain S-box-containing protein
MDENGEILYYEGTVEDITERKKGEDELRESEERYRAIIETNQEWIWQINNEGIHTFSNPAIEQILGYSIEDIVGKNAVTYMHPEDRREIEGMLPKWIENKKGWNNLVLRWLHKDGSIHWLESNAVVMLDVNGELIGFQGSDRDITERKKAEEKIILNEARLQSLYYISQYKSENLQGLLNYALGEAIKLTRSKVGWFGFYQEENRILTIVVWSAETMEECEIAEKQYVFPLENAGIWAEGIRQRKPFLANDFQALDSRRKGYPLGHIELSKFLTIPLFSGDNIVAAIAVANKEQDYDEADILQLTLLMNSVMEITEHRKAEEALRKSEERFRYISSTISDIAYSCSSNQEGVYSIKWMTGATEKIIGYSVNEIKEKQCWGKLVVEEDLPIFEKHVTGLAPGSSGSCELRLRHRDGHTVWVASFAECVKERESTGCLSLYGGLVDITERKLAEEELSKYREHLEELFQTRTLELEKSLSLIRATLDSTADGIIVTDMEQRVQAWNSRFLEVLSIPPELMEQWVEGNFFRHVAQQMVNPQPLKERLERLNIDPYETSQDEFIFKGSQFFECYVGPQKLIDEVIGHVWSFRNITERRQTERALQESERKYKGLAESLTQVVYRADPDTLEENYINGSVLGMYGYTVEEWLSDPSLWKKVIHPEDREWVDALFEEAKVKREEGSVEYRIVRKDGTVIWVSDNFSWEKDRGGKIVSMNGIVYDITEHREAEEKLRKHAEELEKFNRAMVDREKRIVEMKEEVNRLCRELGREPEYPPIWRKEPKE